MTDWLPVLEAEDTHLVSDDGQVRSVDRHITKPNRWGTTTTCFQKGKILAPIPRGQRGYLTVTINGRIRYVHILMLEAFRGPRPPGMQGLHADDDPLNNTFPNLRWDTPTANSLDCVRNGNHPEARRTHCDAGHEYTPDNLRKSQRGRLCAECRRDIEKRSRQRRAEKGL